LGLSGNGYLRDLMTFKAVNSKAETASYDLMLGQWKSNMDDVTAPQGLF